MTGVSASPTALVELRSEPVPVSAIRRPSTDAGKLRVLDLFSGVGGFSLGLERTGGFETAAFCEIDWYCREILDTHWPDALNHHDVRGVEAAGMGFLGPIDVICGGFPCQDISLAGSGAGLAGARSGLWFEFARLIREFRPNLVLVENVSELLGRGMGVVLGSLASLGYSAWWRCIRASEVGARHGRDRVWIVAYPELWGMAFGRRIADTVNTLLDAKRVSRPQPSGGAFKAAPLVDGLWETLERGNETGWKDQPGLARITHDVSSRVAEYSAMGNAVVPDIPELLGNAILSALSSERIAA